MAQRKPPSGGKPAAKKGTSRPSGKPGTGPTARASSAGTAAARKQPPTRKPGKSIVNQKQTPWGLIASVVAVVLFAAAVIVVVIVTQHKSASGGGGCGSANANFGTGNVTVTGTTHFIPMERPDEVARLVVAELRSGA